VTAFDFDKPLLVTERLELWLPRPDDLRPMHAIVTDPVTRRYLGPTEELHGHAIRFMRGAGSWFLYGYGFVTLRLRSSETVIGNAGVFHSFRGLGDDFDDQPEAGWIIGAEHVGKGLGREAMEAVLAWFDATHGPRRIVCLITRGNDASFSLAARVGFVAFRETVLGEDDPVVLLERVPA
jgi:RimJ/RimL family protein N-acetyltransferase